MGLFYAPKILSCVSIYSVNLNFKSMNTLTLVAVFSSGVILTLLTSFLAVYVQNEVKGFKSDSELEQLIANKRKIFEKSRKFLSVPEESQLSVTDAEISFRSDVSAASDSQQFESNTGL